MDSGVLITFALLILSLEAFLKLCSLLYFGCLSLSLLCWLFCVCRAEIQTLNLANARQTFYHCATCSHTPALMLTLELNCLFQMFATETLIILLPKWCPILIIAASRTNSSSCVCCVLWGVLCTVCVVGCVEWCVELGVSCLCVVCVSQRGTDWGRFVFSIISSLLFCQITARSWSILSRKHICFCLMSCFHFFHFPGEFSLFTKAVKRLWCAVFTHGIKNTKERVLRK